MTERERRLAVPSYHNDALAHAMAMVATPLILGFGGTWIDGRLGTGWIFAALLASFGVLGAFASAYYRYEARMAKHDEGKPWTRKAGSS